MGNFYYSVVELNLGRVALVWLNDGLPRLIRVILPEERLSTTDLVGQTFPGAILQRHLLIDRTARGLQEGEAGKEFTVPASVLDLLSWSEFYRRVWRETARIPRGKVNTYGRLAGSLGLPRAARAVGTALAKNPYPLIIPCHRIVQADGGLGGFSAGGPAVKRRLLESEGVGFDARGRVILARYAI